MNKQPDNFTGNGRFRAIVFTIMTGFLILVSTIIVFSEGDSLLYGTFLGAGLTEKGYGIEVDDQGRAYVIGYTESTTFPTSIGSQPEAHGVDAFAARFAADGAAADYILWFNALSLIQEDYGFDVALGEDNSAYIVGQTFSDDFCAVFGSVPGYDTSYNGGGDGFLLKILPDGSGLAYCTYLGGAELDTASSVAVDSAGNAYVTGGTWSTDFITSTNTVGDRHYGLRDAYVLRIDSTGTVVLHASFIGGGGQEESRGIALDSQANVYVTGWTNSDDFITTTGVIGPSYGGAFDGFVVKVDTITPALDYATYLGGDAEDRGYSVAAAPDGVATIAGVTLSEDFPTTANAYAQTPGGGYDGFVTRINGSGTAIQFSSYLGGSGDDTIYGLDLDPAQNSYVTGETWSTDFPTTTNAISSTLPGVRSAFVAVLNLFGSDLTYSSYLGGSDWDEGVGITVADDGRVYVTGATRSADFPTTPGAYDISHNGDYDIFVAKLDIIVDTLLHQAYFPAVLK